jgi:hypothetical protein
LGSQDWLARNQASAINLTAPHFRHLKSSEPYAPVWEEPIARPSSTSTSDDPHPRQTTLNSPGFGSKASRSILSALLRFIKDRPGGSPRGHGSIMDQSFHPLPTHPHSPQAAAGTSPLFVGLALSLGPVVPRQIAKRGFRVPALRHPPSLPPPRRKRHPPTISHLSIRRRLIDPTPSSPAYAPNSPA